jgi:cellulase/cellobiase CelA1
MRVRSLLQQFPLSLELWQLRPQRWLRFLRLFGCKISIPADYSVILILFRVGRDTAAKVPLMGTFLGNIKALNAAGASPPVAGTFVVYDLPDRDCAALASNGEYTIANNGVANYKAYIDAIKALLVTYSDVKVILVIGKTSTLYPTLGTLFDRQAEPDSLANLVTNLSVAKCANAEAAYKECIVRTLTYQVFHF